MNPPAHRIRLFLSVDLVGSTAFKAQRGSQTAEQDVYPIWIAVTRSFYSVFQSTFRSEYESELSVASQQYILRPPRMWKIVGDEIIFCSCLVDLDHLAITTNAFIRALEVYSKAIRTDHKELDVKGTGWLAAFQSPNFTIPVPNSNITGMITEEIELKADERPSDFDFLGADIDAGFRLSEFATYDKMAISIAYAKCLCDAAYHQMFSHKLIYKGRKVLKGVFAGEPYPIILIETERDPKRRELDTYERAVNPSKEVEYLNLANFARSFLELNQADNVSLCKNGEIPKQPSEQHCKFMEKWQAGSKEEEKRGEIELQASEQENDDPELEQHEIGDWSSFEAAQARGFPSIEQDVTLPAATTNGAVPRTTD